MKCPKCEKGDLRKTEIVPNIILICDDCLTGFVGDDGKVEESDIFEGPKKALKTEEQRTREREIMKTLPLWEP